MTTTTDKQSTCEERIDAELASTAETFRRYMNEPELCEEGDGDLPPFHEYGLCFDYVEPGTFNDRRCGFYRYQLSWGGPSDEVRFHPDGSITYHYMDWFDGAERPVLGEDWARWLRDTFEELEMITWGDVDLY